MLPFYWLNALSLDAVLIALAWQEIFAQQGSVILSWQDRVLLGISVWLVYILDHLLDSFTQVSSVLTSLRHRFIKKNRLLFFGLILLGGSADLLLAFHLDLRIRHGGIALGIVTGTYLLFNALVLKQERWLYGREIIIGLIFSWGCALVPLMQTSAPSHLFLWIAGFAYLAIINCILIARMERLTLPSFLSHQLLPSPTILLWVLFLFGITYSFLFLPSIFSALLMSFCGLTMIPMIAKRYGYETASLATDGTLFIGALLTLLLTYLFHYN